jgi:poly-beta-1,6-N-acetyl-D-glucosamine biosynthesis protein PgaD
MSGRKPWPPLIVAGDVPPWIKRRDFALTAAMWLLFLYMLDDEFALVLHRNLVRFGLGHYRTDPNWADYLEDLGPHLSIGLVLIVLLVLATISTLIWRWRASRLPPPQPLALAAEARRAGLSEPDLAHARDLAIAVVHIEPDGRHRIEPGRTS